VLGGIPAPWNRPYCADLVPPLVISGRDTAAQKAEKDKHRREKLQEEARADIIRKMVLPILCISAAVQPKADALTVGYTENHPCARETCGPHLDKPYPGMRYLQVSHRLLSAPVMIALLGEGVFSRRHRGVETTHVDDVIADVKKAAPQLAGLDLVLASERVRYDARNLLVDVLSTCAPLVALNVLEAGAPELEKLRPSCTSSLRLETRTELLRAPPPQNCEEEEEFDPLKAFLPAGYSFADKGPLSQKEAEKVKQDCLRNLKERLVERKEIIEQQLYEQQHELETRHTPSSARRTKWILQISRRTRPATRQRDSRSNSCRCDSRSTTRTLSGSSTNCMRKSRPIRD